MRSTSPAKALIRPHPHGSRPALSTALPGFLESSCGPKHQNATSINELNRLIQVFWPAEGPARPICRHHGG